MKCKNASSGDVFAFWSRISALSVCGFIIAGCASQQSQQSQQSSKQNANIVGNQADLNSTSANSESLEKESSKAVQPQNSAAINNAVVDDASSFETLDTGAITNASPLNSVPIQGASQNQANASAPLQGSSTTLNTALTLEPAQKNNATPTAVGSNGVANMATSKVADSSEVIEKDLGPAHGVLQWVGYNYKKDDHQLEIQIVTEGRPVYKVFQEINRARQSEIVVRFLNTDVRHKIRRDIDATEFRSPVAYIRMRRDNIFRHTDVILTMRDPVQPRMFAKGSNVMLTFDVPERWFGPSGEQSAPISKLEIQPDANLLPAVSKDAAATSDSPISSVATYVDDPGKDVFKGVPASKGQPLVPAKGSKELIPANAPKEPVAPTPMEGKEEVQFKEKRFSVVSVAQAASNYAADIPPPITNGVQTPGMDQNIITDTPVNAVPSNAIVPGNGVPVPANATPGPVQATPTAVEVTGVDQTALPVPASDPSKPKKVLKFDFRNATIGSILRVISAESGFNFVMPPEISSKKITVSLNNIAWDVALKAVLESNRLGMEEIGPKIIRIDDLKTFVDDRDAQDKARQATEALIPTKVLVMRLSYANAEDAAKMVLQMLPKPADSTNIAQKRNYDRFKVQADRRSNAVIVEAIPTEIAKIKTLLERIDMQTPQVKISSRIVEIITGAEQALGISWGSPMNIDGGRGLGFGALPFPNSLTSTFSVDPALKGDAVGALTMRFGSINNLTALDLRIKMLENRSEAESLQNQDVQVEDNEEANIVAGVSDYFTIQGSSNSPGSLQEVAYNTSLKVKPHITADGAVQMKLEIKGDASVASKNPSAAAAKTSRNLSTTLLRKSGDTAVIGGLYATDRSKATSGIPILSKLPIIGALFRSTYNVESRRDLLIMITPSIQSGFGVASDASGTGASLQGAPSPVAINSTQSASAAPPASTNEAGNVAFDAQKDASSAEKQGAASQNTSANYQGNATSQQGSQEQGNTLDVSDDAGLE